MLHRCSLAAVDECTVWCVSWVRAGCMVSPSMLSSHIDTTSCYVCLGSRVAYLKVLACLHGALQASSWWCGRCWRPSPARMRGAWAPATASTPCAWTASRRASPACSHALPSTQHRRLVLLSSIGNLQSQKSPLTVSLSKQA